MGHIQSVTVFCASREGSKEVRELYMSLAIETGQMLAQEGLVTIYGGGGNGLMGAVAQGVDSAGGEIHGIMPELFRSSAKGAPDSVQKFFTPNMATRKEKLIADSNAIITLPGGIGTLDEVAETFMFNYLKFNQRANTSFKPNIFIDPLDYWKGFFEWAELSVKQGMSDSSFLQTMVRVKTVEEARIQIQEWQTNPLKVELAQMPEMKVEATTNPPERREQRPASPQARPSQ